MEFTCAEHKADTFVTLNLKQLGGAPPVKTSHLLCVHLALQPQDVTLVVTHGPCPDGYAAALAAFGFKPSLKILHVNHDQLAELGPRVEGESVVFLDIAPKFARLQTWRMKNYAILNHHKTAEGDLKKVPEANKVFRMDLSGCVLAWHFFFPDFFVPHLYEVVQARDLWLKERVKHCDEICAALMDTTCAGCWARGTYDVAPLVAIGTELEKNRRRKVNAYVEAAELRQWRGTRTWVIHCPDVICISDVGNQLVRRPGCEADIAMIYRSSEDGDRSDTLVSLRSLAPGGPDVSNICAEYGGGGHKNAAGFTLKSATVETLFRKDDGPK